MIQYFLMTNEEAAVPSVDSWIQQQDQLGCYGCRRVQFPRTMNIEIEYVSSFSNITTKSSRVSNIRAKFGGGVAIVLQGLADAIGMESLNGRFFVGTVSCKSQLVPYCSLVPREPEMALPIGSKAPLDIIRCNKCSSALHAFDGAPCVEASSLSDPIYAVDCEVDSFVIDTNTKNRIEALNFPEVVLTPVELVNNLTDVI